MLRRAVLAAILRSHSRDLIQRPMSRFSVCCLQTLQGNLNVPAESKLLTQQQISCSFSTGPTSADIPGNGLLPKPRDLITVHELLEKLVPMFMTHHCLELHSVLDDNVSFEDQIFNYQKKGISPLMTHMAKVRTYFHITSPYKKTELIGSYIFDDKVVMLWRLKVMKTTILSYITRFILMRDRYDLKEGALELFVGADGKVYKMCNRKMDSQDVVIAGKFAELKGKKETVKQKPSP